MARAQNDTKARIGEVALELFGRQGYERTSLREIAERLDITKAALYYHYPSKRDLLRALSEPLRQDAMGLAERFDGRADEPREVLGAYFDLCVRHSTLMVTLLHDLAGLSESGLVEEVVAWRRRLDVALVGEDAPIPARMGAVAALGGIQDIAVLMPAEEATLHRGRAVEIALAALRVGMSDMD
ncbi:TetR family transcriptional regulator [Nocardiopsis alba]|uniref:TetR family transcriptional regulator n=1 Tax=Nocardiopsis alba TaxID=53437 RepID=A0A7K2IUK7_9ACTN|nr:TetR/AcrR family transcriptional regulator [Nocardiopsis sp. LDBS1602]MEC3895237.1 helix-turn-helix domain-containing protein [Nocardiopsis sp. LDBS1602]MYR33650.1 TetR family transcriptional regulator [Nocardiopsis alba]